MNFEFCVGAFSIFEGLGSAIWLRENNLDGDIAKRVKASEWQSSLVKLFDPTGQFGLNANVDSVRKVRDKLHQDQLGARENIDWHDFSFESAFAPAINAMRCLLQTNADHVPTKTNLKDK
jgi:hypothetical protein